nr:hypothetical protein [Tanacetum cinerariifolium]
MIKGQVDSLMKNAISLTRNSKNLCGLSSNEIRHLPLELSHHEAFKVLVINFILDQEEKVWQLEEYMEVIKNDFMQLSLEVVKKSKEEIRMKEHNSSQFKRFKKSQSISLPRVWIPVIVSKRARSGKSTMGQSSSSHEPTIEEKVYDLGVFVNNAHQMNYNALTTCFIHSGNVIDWSFIAKHGLERGFFESINSDPFSGPQ